MTKSPPREDPSMLETSKLCKARRHRRHIEKQAKAKGYETTCSNSNSNPNPANPTHPASAPASAQKARISRPQIAKSSVSFGLKIYDLILRDIVQLQAPIDANVDESGVRESGKMTQLAKLVLAQAGLPQRQLHALDQTPAMRTPTNITPEILMFPTEYDASNAFQFSKLPAELRIMIEQLVFTASSGKKPKMLWAMKGNQELYAEAKEVWCKTNEFGFTYHDSSLNKIRQEMGITETRLVKRALVTVSKDIQACTIFCSTILLFSNVTHLTLRVHTTSGFCLATHHIIPKMSNLKHITVQIQGPKRTVQSHNSFDGAEFFRPFLKTRIMLDKMLNWNGRCVHVGQRMQEWIWKMEGDDEVFKPRSQKVHIRFDEDAEQFALDTDQS